MCTIYGSTWENVHRDLCWQSVSHLSGDKYLNHLLVYDDDDDDREGKQANKICPKLKPGRLNIPHQTR